jgi:hypothetical protein
MSTDDWYIVAITALIVTVWLSIIIPVIIRRNAEISGQAKWWRLMLGDPRDTERDNPEDNGDDDE